MRHNHMDSSFIDGYVDLTSIDAENLSPTLRDDDISEEFIGEEDQIRARHQSLTLFPLLHVTSIGAQQQEYEEASE
jgi:hypothetical protein